MEADALFIRNKVMVDNQTNFGFLSLMKGRKEKRKQHTKEKIRYYLLRAKY